MCSKYLLILSQLLLLSLEQLFRLHFRLLGVVGMHLSEQMNRGSGVSFLVKF